MIELPWPDKALSPNSRAHRMAKHRATKKARINAAWATIASEAQAPAEGDIALTVELTPPNSLWDRTNCEAACKALLDGVADGLKVNDRRFDVSWVHKPAQKPGKVIVTLSSPTQERAA